MLTGIETNKRIGRLRLQAITPILQRLVWQLHHTAPCTLTRPRSTITSKHLLTFTIQALPLPVHPMHLRTTLQEKNLAVGSEVGTRQAYNEFTLSRISEILVGSPCGAALYPCPQSKEPACSVSYATKPRNQEHIWRKPFHL